MIQGRKAENRAQYERLIDLLNPIVDFCNDVVDLVLEQEIMQLGREMWGENDTTARADISELTVEEYRQLKAEGMSDKDVCVFLGTDNNHLSRWKKKNSLTKIPKGISKQAVVQMYQSGTSQTVIAQFFKVSVSHISQILLKAGVR